MADPVVDQLEVVDVEEEQADDAFPGTGLVDCLGQAAGEELPVRQVGQGVVVDPVLQGAVGAAALDRVAEHVGGGPEEVAVLFAEGAEPVGVDDDDPELVDGPHDRGDHRTAHRFRQERREPFEPRVIRPGRDQHHVALGQVAVRVLLRVVGQHVGPAQVGRSMPEMELLVVLLLPDRGLDHIVELADPLDRVLKQRVRILAPDRHLAEPGHQHLLLGLQLDRGFGRLEGGDVLHHPMPEWGPVFVPDQPGPLVDPYVAPVAGPQPVLGRGMEVEPDQPLVLEGERVVAIVGMDRAVPERGVRGPLIGRIAEDLLDLRADVMPAARLAHLGRVEDGRHRVDQVLEALGVHLLPVHVVLRRGRTGTGEGAALFVGRVGVLAEPDREGFGGLLQLGHSGRTLGGPGGGKPDPVKLGMGETSDCHAVQGAVGSPDRDPCRDRGQLGEQQRVELGRAGGDRPFVVADHRSDRTELLDRRPGGDPGGLVDRTRSPQLVQQRLQ